MTSSSNKHNVRMQVLEKRKKYN